MDEDTVKTSATKSEIAENTPAKSDATSTTPASPSTPLVSREQMLRFRRITWALTKLVQGELEDHKKDDLRGRSTEFGKPSDEVDTGEESKERKDDTGGSDEDLDQSESLEGSDVLRAFATLSARNNKVVAAVASMSCAAFLEETSPNDASDDIRPTEDAFWTGNTGIRFTDVRNSVPKFELGPQLSLAQHLNRLISYISFIKNSCKRPTAKLRKRAFEESFSRLISYVLKSCYPKISQRIEYHCEALNSNIHLRSAVDYSTYLTPMPSVYESTNLVTFKGYDKLSKWQDKALTTIWENRQQRPVGNFLEDYVMSDGDASRLKWAASLLKIPFEKNDCECVFNCFTSMLQIYISGVMAMKRAATGKEKHFVLFEKEVWKSSSSMDPAMASGLCTTASAGSHLADLAHSTLLDRILNSVFDHKERNEGCRKWLRFISAPFYSATILVQDKFIQQIDTADLFVIETFHKENDTEMEPIESFLQSICKDKHSDLFSDIDIRRLLHWLQKASNSSSVFSGTVHCETSLLLLYITAKMYPDVLPKAIKDLAERLNPMYLGISKKSCPFCTKVIGVSEKLLSMKIENATGSHSTYSACGLPEWLPAPLADIIISKVEADCVPKLEERAERLVPKTEGVSRGTSSPKRGREYKGAFELSIASTIAETNAAFVSSCQDNEDYDEFVDAEEEKMYWGFEDD